MSAPQRRTLFCSLLLAIPLSILAALVFVVYSCNNPRDRVSVTITGAARDVVFACPVAESRGRIEGMKLYRSHIFGPFTMSHLHSLDSPSDDGDFSDRVGWLPGDRYGVITATSDGEWWIVWFDADSVRLTDRSIFMGGGSVVFDLSKGQTEKLTDEEVRKLGLSLSGTIRRR